MPRRKKPPRLYLDPARKEWVIRDGPGFIRTGCREGDIGGAENALAQYIGHKHKPEKSPSPLIADILTVYAKEVAAHRKTRRNLSYQLGKILAWWGNKNVSEINAQTCRAYAATRTNNSAGYDLRILHAACSHWHKEYGPLGVMPSFWRPEESGPRERWLTRSEAARLLRAAKNYQHIKRMVLLGLYTGSRPGVILALAWDQIDFHSGTLTRVKGKQDSKKRAPPVKLGRRILGHLRRWKKIDQLNAPNAASTFLCHWNGQRVRDPHAAWHKTVTAAGLTGVTRHTLRHTRATWLMQAGVPIWEAAGHLGMSTRTLESVYGKHSPHFQERAANI